MNHDEAMLTNAAEGYWLNDLEEAEKEAFEAHMFDCTICAEESQLFYELRESLRGNQDLDPRFHTAHAAAAYVLGDLIGSEKENFEAHMLRCRACLQHVSLGVEILANLHRAIKGEMASGARRVAALQFSRWFQLVFGD